MKDRYLYLLGGHSFQEESNRQFIEHAGGSNARIALCIMYRPGWEEYVPLFRQLWEDAGARNVQVIVPHSDGNLDMVQAERVLSQATGIFIGGGDTEQYHHYYATGRFKEILIGCYMKGVPIAGNSAGALILPEVCLISPQDNVQGKLLFKQGVGLLTNILISVHYTEWGDQPNLLEGMRTKEIKHGMGIDEQACAVFRNEQLAFSLGEAVHSITFKDFVRDEYMIERVTS